MELRPARLPRFPSKSLEFLFSLKRTSWLLVHYREAVRDSAWKDCAVFIPSAAEFEGFFFSFFHNLFPALSFSSLSCLLLPLPPFLLGCQKKSTYPTVIFAGSLIRCNSCPQVPHLPPLTADALSPGTSGRQARPYQTSYVRSRCHRKPRPPGKRVSLLVFHSPFFFSKALKRFGGF